MGKWWENDGKMMGKWWDNDGKMMGTWWENDGTMMGKWWDDDDWSVDLGVSFAADLGFCISFLDSLDVFSKYLDPYIDFPLMIQLWAGKYHANPSMMTGCVDCGGGIMGELHSREEGGRGFWWVASNMGWLWLKTAGPSNDVRVFMWFIIIARWKSLFGGPTLLSVYFWANPHVS